MCVCVRVCASVAATCAHGRCLGHSAWVLPCVFAFVRAVCACHVCVCAMCVCRVSVCRVCAGPYVFAFDVRVTGGGEGGGGAGPCVSAFDVRATEGGGACKCAPEPTSDVP